MLDLIQTIFSNIYHFSVSFTQEIQEHGGGIIPEISFNQITRNGNRIPSDIASKVYKRGILIIRSVLSKEEAASFYDQLTDYMENNGEDPKAVGKTFYEVYWSKAQVDHEYFDVL